MPGKRAETIGVFLIIQAVGVRNQQWKCPSPAPERRNCSSLLTWQSAVTQAPFLPAIHCFSWFLQPPWSSSIDSYPKSVRLRGVRNNCGENSYQVGCWLLPAKAGAHCPGDWASPGGWLQDRPAQATQDLLPMKGRAGCVSPPQPKELILQRNFEAPRQHLGAQILPSPLHTCWSVLGIACHAHPSPIRLIPENSWIKLHF